MLANYSEIPSASVLPAFGGVGASDLGGQKFGKSSLQQKLIDQFESQPDDIFSA